MFWEPVGVSRYASIAGVAYQCRPMKMEYLIQSEGERRMRPNFGCDIHTLVFAPNNASTWGLAANYVEEALGMWEPRIEVMEVEAFPDPEDISRLLIDVKFSIKATNDARNIVYPFYLLGRV
jgi:uncharacterized protein